MLATVVILIAALVLLFGFIGGKRFCYIMSLIIMTASCVPFLISFEKKKPSAGELAVLASMCALAAASRAAFYALPAVKPICAVIIITAASLGAETGFLAGALSAFASNFIFGQGIWTPFQMLALGMVGLVSGLLFGGGRLMKHRIVFALSGALITFVFYGLIVDLSSVLMFLNEFTVKKIVSIYAAGIPFNASLAAATFAVLLIAGKPLYDILDRIKNKYGLFV